MNLGSPDSTAVPDVRRYLKEFLMDGRVLDAPFPIRWFVVNCLILGRAEAFASKNTVGRSILDGLGMGVGFAFALLCLGAVREILGAGSLFGVRLFHDDFQEWVVMVLPSGGFFTLAAWLLLFNAWRKRRERLAEEPVLPLGDREAVR